MLIREEFLPTKTSKSKALILISLVIGVYILENTAITSFIGFSIFSNIIKPLLWCGIAFTVWLLPRIKPKSRLKHKSMINWWSFNFAVIYIIVSMVIGVFIEGLGKSPYSHTPKAMLINIVTIGTVLIGREIVRSYLVNSFTDEENFFVFILTALFMTISSLAIRSFIDLKGYEGIVQFIAESFAPSFSENLFATYLVFLGGPLTSIIYLGITQAFHWLSPVLPNLKWITKALIGVMSPIFFLMSIQSIYLDASKEQKKSEKEEESTLSWIITSILSISIVWFSVGVFPIYPSVIATGSMEPEIKPGDVILVEKIKDIEGIHALKTGDVIQFKKDSILISHRIIDIIEEKEGIRFKTKGDNNSGEDEDLVKPENIKGKVVYSIPKVGLLTLLIKSEDDVQI